MFQTFKNAWKIDELRKKILYTLLILLIFRLGAAIPAPFVDAKALAASMMSNTNTIFGFFDMMTGGSFSLATLFALGVSPYINASIIIQLLQVVIPALERWSKEGEEGRNKINKLTRYSSIILSVSMGIVYYILLKNQGVLVYNFSDGFSGVFAAIVIVGCLAGGSVLLMWLGEQIDTKGIGNGISLIIFIGIISNLANFIQTFIACFQMAAGRYVTNASALATGAEPVYAPAQPQYWALTPLVIIVLAATFVMIIVMTSAERRIPVQYAKRVVGRKLYGGQNTNIPIKVNMTGVLPIIFASTFLSIPATLNQFFNWDSKFLDLFDTNGWLYAVLYALFIIGFNYFYVAVQY
ncbi:MAG: preprotein translocase subunit SecY, partial [Ruminococcaceae bacterium]|nr:preprotein translocase subunit SecY [Oscillospiraceae bacterium]